MKSKFLFILILISLALLSVKTYAQTTKSDTLSVLPDADVYDINGKHTTLHELAKNKVLFIDCWFIPCPPCFVVMGPLHKVYAEYAANSNVCFITICMTDSAQVKQFIRQDTIMKAYVSQFEYFSHLNGFKLPVYFIDGCSSRVPVGVKNLSHFAPDDKSKCPDVLFKFTGYPTCMVFDKRGKLVYKDTGFDTVDSYEQHLTTALNNALANTN